MGGGHHHDNGRICPWNGCVCLWVQREFCGPRELFAQSMNRQFQGRRVITLYVRSTDSHTLNFLSCVLVACLQETGPEDNRRRNLYTITEVWCRPHLPPNAYLSVARPPFRPSVHLVGVWRAWHPRHLHPSAARAGGDGIVRRVLPKHMRHHTRQRAGTRYAHLMATHTHMWVVRDFFRPSVHQSSLRGVVACRTVLGRSSTPSSCPHKQSHSPLSHHTHPPTHTHTHALIPYLCPCCLIADM